MNHTPALAPTETLAGFAALLRDHGLTVGVAEQQAMLQAAMALGALNGARLNAAWRAIAPFAAGRNASCAVTRRALTLSASALVALRGLKMSALLRELACACPGPWHDSQPVLCSLIDTFIAFGLFAL